MDLSHFVRELRRRRVFRVLAAYSVAAFAVLQVTEPLMHALHLADWVLTAVVVMLALGFPVAMALSWAYDLVPGGLERTPPVEGSEATRGPVVPLLLLGLAGGTPGLAWVLLRRSGQAEVPVWALVGGTLGLAATVAVVAWLVGRREPEPAPRAAARAGGRAVGAREFPAVAVLPFADLSQDRDQEYFCDGIAEELLGALCGLSGLRVVARNSSFQFKGRTVDSRDIGSALGADTLLEGSVRKAGSQVRVAARLVDAREGLELWSERFDRELTDVFAVQGEIAQAVARAMRLRLSSREEERLRKRGAGRKSRDPRAYECYLRGRHLLMLHGDRMRTARVVFREAIALDPTFAEAQAGLADAIFMAVHWNLESEGVDELRAEALAASEEALRLEPELAEAHLARANVLTLLGRHREAEGDFLHAVELNPGWGDSCYFYARALVESGRFEDAAGAFEEAARRNPDDYASLCLLVGVHERRKDPAATRATAARALAAVERRLHLDPADDRALYLGATIDVPHGDRARGFQRIERVVELRGDEFAALYNAACFYARAGEHGRALDLLDRAVGPGRGSRPWMERDPDLDPLRADPRYLAIVGRVRS